MTTTQALTGGILKILNIFELLAVYLVDRLLYLSVEVTGDKY